MRAKGSWQHKMAADLVERRGGIMRIGRTIIIPAILALGVAGAALAGSEVSAAVAHTSGSHVQATASSAGPDLLYHG
jgi:hypothetical protein